METALGFHRVSTEFPDGVETVMNTVKTACKPTMVSTGFPQLGGTLVETVVGFQGFHTISIGCGNHVEPKADSA